MASNSQDKLIELETKFSFQEDMLADLNNEIIRQQRQINEILRELEVLKLQLSAALERDPDQADSPGDSDKPPHY